MSAPDIFLSYNREDQIRAKVFAQAFEAQGFSVWWDVGLKTGEAYDEVTEAALRSAKAVVVLWSKKSVFSRWVRAEATLADRNKTLVPCMIEACERPIMFELTQTAELTHWQGDASDSAWRSFLSDVYRFVAKGGAAPSAPPVAPLAATATSTSSAPTAALPVQGGKPHGAKPSIAILPFTNRSTERADEVFAGGMGEDIASALSLGRGLKVISQGATAAYRKNTSDLRAIGQELGAKYMLEGNVRRVGASLRVTAQLVEADNGAILWTQKFDRPLSELSELQEELVEELAAHLGVQIQKVEMERALRKPGDITAWEAVMRSWASYARMNPESVAIAVAEARRAVSLAPDYAVARATLSMGLALLHQQTGYRDRALIDEAIEHAETALSLNPNHASVLFQVANTYCVARKIAEAMQLAGRAVELNPSLVDARQALAMCLNHFERYEEALIELAEGDRLSPRAFQQVLGLGHRCWALYGLGRLDEALVVASEYVRLDPKFRFALMTLPAFLQELGRTAEAQDAIRKARNAEPNEGLDFWIGLMRGSYISDPMYNSVSKHFIDVWNATPMEAEQ
jgi:TolB-like protein/Flp pilus assembly protein TadD